MPDCNLPNNHRFDFCTTNALGYLLGVIPLDIDEKIEHMEDPVEAVDLYLLYGQQLYTRIRDFHFTPPRHNNKILPTKLIKEPNWFWEKLEIVNK